MLKNTMVIDDLMLKIDDSQNRKNEKIDEENKKDSDFAKNFLENAINANRKTSNAVEVKNKKEEMKEKGCTTIGMTSVAIDKNTSYIVYAKLINSSSEDNPIVQISYGHGEGRKTYWVTVNDVNPNNATDMEMFALLSYEGYQGRKIGGAINNYSAYRMMKMNDGQEIDDEETFTSVRRDAVDMIHRVKSWLIKIKAEDAQEEAKWCDDLLNMFKNNI